MRPGIRLVLGLLSLCVSAAAAQTLNRGNGPEPDSLDPARAQGLSAHQVLRDLFEGLVIEDAGGRLVAGSALTWSVSENGLSWIFKLRPQASFSDGSPVRAADFVYSLNRALTPATAAPYAGLLLPIRGAKARLEGADRVLAVTAVDPLTLEIHLEQPCPDLPARLSLPVAMPVKQAQVEADAGQFTRAGKLLGNGAYRLVDWQPGAWLELERSPAFHAVDTVRIERVRFFVTEDAAAEARRFEGGELHLTETVPPQPLARLRERYGEALQVGPAHGSFFLGLNLQRPPFAGAPGLREALSLAVDRELLVRVVTGTGEAPAYGLLPPLLRSVPIQPLARDAALRRARELYAQAGYGPDRVLRLELRYNSSSLNRRLMLAVAAMWEEQLGVQTRLRNEEWKVFVRNRRARVLTQVFRGGWNADLADPLNFLEPFTADSNLNATGFADPGFDVLLAQAQQTPALDQRAQLLEQAEQRLLDQFPIIPLFHYTSKHLVSPKLKGFEHHPLDHHPSRWLSWR